MNCLDCGYLIETSCCYYCNLDKKKVDPNYRCPFFKPQK